MQALLISERNMMYTNNNINEHNDEDGEMITVDATATTVINLNNNNDDDDEIITVDATATTVINLNPE